MNILKKFTATKKIEPLTAPTAADSARGQDGQGSQGGHDASQIAQDASGTRDTNQCPQCGYRFFWLDYAATQHCCNCDRFQVRAQAVRFFYFPIVGEPLEIFLPRENYNPDFEIIDFSTKQFGVWIYFPNPTTKNQYVRAGHQTAIVANF